MGSNDISGLLPILFIGQRTTRMLLCVTWKCRAENLAWPIGVFPIYFSQLQRFPQSSITLLRHFFTVIAPWLPS